MMPIGIQSHHMAGRLPTRAQEHARCNDRGGHDREQQPAGDGATRNRSGGDCMKVGEQHGDQIPAVVWRTCQRCKHSLNPGVRRGTGRGRPLTMTTAHDPIAVLIEHGEEHGCVRRASCMSSRRGSSSTTRTPRTCSSGSRRPGSTSPTTVRARTRKTSRTRTRRSPPPRRTRSSSSSTRRAATRCSPPHRRWSSRSASRRATSRPRTCSSTRTCGSSSPSRSLPGARPDAARPDPGRDLGLIRAAEKFDWRRASSSRRTRRGGSARRCSAVWRTGAHDSHPGAHRGASSGSPRAERTLVAKLECPPTDEEVGSAAKLPVKQVREVRAAARAVVRSTSRSARTIGRRSATS